MLGVVATVTCLMFKFYTHRNVSKRATRLCIIKTRDGRVTINVVLSPRCLFAHVHSHRRPAILCADVNNLTREKNNINKNSTSNFVEIDFSMQKTHGNDSLMMINDYIRKKKKQYSAAEEVKKNDGEAYSEDIDTEWTNETKWKKRRTETKTAIA